MFEASTLHSVNIMSSVIVAAIDNAEVRWSRMVLIFGRKNPECFRLAAS